MAKTNFLQWSSTANSNSDVGGINIAEGCPPSNINNAIREVMAQLASGVDGEMVYVTKSANYTALGTDNNAYYRFTASATLSLTAVATLAANWHMWVKADGGDVTVDPNGAETINGAATLVIRNGESALIVSSGTAFYANLAPNNTPFTYSVKTANYTALDGDYNTTFRFTSAATLAFDVTANLRTNWRIEVWNDSTGLVIIDPDSTNTINGSTTLAIQPGQRMEIYKTSSTAFQGAFYADTYSGPQLQGYYFGLALTTAADAANDITVATGAAAADTANYDLMQLTSAVTKQIDAAWAAGNNAGGLDTGSVGNNTYYIWLIRRPDTGVVDALYSLSSTAPTMPTNYTQKRLIGQTIRASATNGTPSSIWVDLTNRGRKFFGTFALSGTATTINSIPPAVSVVHIIFPGLTVSASAKPLVRMGTSGSIFATGYSGFGGSIISGSAGGSADTTGIPISGGGTTTGTWRSSVMLERSAPGSNIWQITSVGYSVNGAGVGVNSTEIDLGDELTRLQVTTAAGTATIGDNANIWVEF